MRTNKKESISKYLNEILPDAKCELNYSNIYELIVSVILSAQTTDYSVNKITPNLFEKYPTFFDLANAPIEKLEYHLKTLGLFKIKASRIKEVSNIILEKYNGIVPNNIEDLTSIKGIGRKTASVILVEYYDIAAFPVDTHVHRIAIRLGIAKNTDSILVVEQKLRVFFENYDWKKLHHQLIAFGRYYCKAKKPLCEICKLKEFCSYYKKTRDN